MGLEEHIKAGAQLTRDTKLFTLPSGSGSFDLGPVFSILRIQSSIPARLRLYDRESSRDDVTEVNRPFGQFIATSSISLIGDFSMSAAGTYTIAPPLFGMCSSSNPSETYYRLETAVGQPSQSVLRITRFLLEDRAVQPDPLTFYEVSNRRVITIQAASSMSNDTEYRTGTITAINGAPKTYMIVSASIENSTQQVRLRLYATSSALSNATEEARPFTTEPSDVVQLITDAIISGSDMLYFSPKIFGANLETMGDDLLQTAESLAKIAGNNEIYYRVQNVSGFSANPVIKLAIYSLED